jgi:hypothetical protein
LTGDDKSFFSGELETIVEALELENEDGQLLQNMYRIEVIFYWRGSDGEWQQQGAETWRYGNLYRPYDAAGVLPCWRLSLRLG